MSRLPMVTARYLQQLTDQLEYVLGHQLVGVYVGGSASFGDLNRESDLDLVAVVSAKLRRNQIEALSARLFHDQLPCPQEGLELYIVKKSVVRLPSREPAYEMLLRTGKTWRSTVEKRGYEIDLLLDFAICRQEGLKIKDYYPSPIDLFTEISPHRILRALDQSLQWRLNHILHPFHDPQGENAVLNACRAWSYKQKGVFDSKTAAGEWAIQQSESTHDQRLINQALAIRKGIRKKRLDQELVRSFVNRARRALRARFFYRVIDWLRS